MLKPLTKSRFKLGLECPNKLYYTSKFEYANSKLEDPFLKALAQGGFQVEELARMSFPKGLFVDADHHEYEKAVEFTSEEFAKENTTLFEAAFAYENLFVRTDIVEKVGSKVRLIEVKAKSFDPSDDYCFVGKRGGLVASWKPYLFDIAFQKYVAQKQYPYLDFTAYLMMADKTKKAQIDGLNQVFRIPKNGDPRTDIEKRISSISEIGETVLSEVNVDEIINKIIDSEFRYFDNLTFEETIDLFTTTYQSTIYPNWPAVFSSCKKCEFKTNHLQKEHGLKSGFEECFQKQFGWSKDDFSKPNALEIWDFQGKNLMDENRLLMEQLTEDDFNIKVEAGKISASERKWMQVEKAVNADLSVHLERDLLKSEMDKWIYPLHFIDFETSAVALPFTKGKKPYEQVAFQFSEHVYYEDGTIQHKSQYLNAEPGVFPNFEFVRKLKQTLEIDEGSIFRFADHENTILNAILKQLNESDEIDKLELVEFIKSITHSSKNSSENWCGNRDMIDLRKIILHFYYNPLTKGSNSIKFVLPAAISSSPYLQKKYSQEIKNIGVTSKNLRDSQIWFQIDEDKNFINPYKLLPPLFENWNEEELEMIISDMDDIADGGAALTAYAKLQYTDMSDKERKELTSGLLKYCELDTLAMVMIYEHLKFDF
ncbi:DUF2779 domain-containing protein [Soonwooa sp.]|uniref:DUF2779 domain-containing protein n=1 Tax=Soonwooa sp. TaxID=1938592 RepID=UPI0028A232BF|nr:DUF2779 domain-containing protein [Soonwooa sp.]